MGQAFALREEYRGTVVTLDEDGKEVEVNRFRGGSFSLPDGTTVDLTEALGEDGGGTIVAQDANMEVHLDHMGYFKRVGQPGDGDQVTELSELDGLNAAQLRKLPEAQGINGRHQMKVDELRERVQLVRDGFDGNSEDTRQPDRLPAVADDPDSGRHGGQPTAQGGGTAADPARAGSASAGSTTSPPGHGPTTGTSTGSVTP